MSFSPAKRDAGLSVVEFIKCFIILLLEIPVGFCSRIYDFIVMNSIFGWKRSEEEHARRVSKIQDHVRKWKQLNSKKKMCTAIPAWRSISPSKTDKSGWHQVPIPLNKVITIDKEKRELTVEPGMMIGQLTRILVPTGWTIPVIPEYSILTVGGLVAGAGLESSSHKYGLFCDTVLSYEIVLPDATVVTCSKDHNSDLFFSIPGSYGTLGFITAVKIQLIPVTPYTALTYHYCSSPSSMKNLIITEGVKHEFIEAFAYNDEESVLMFGNFASGPVPTELVNNINRFYKPFFHRHAESVMKKLKHQRGATVQEYIPTIDYYHRHCRGAFWVLEEFNPIWKFRPLTMFLGWLLPVNLHAQALAPFVITRVKKQMVLQDYIFPMKHYESFFRKASQDFKVFPIWICPVMIFKNPTMFPRPEVTEDLLCVDLGFYGTPYKGCDKPKLLKKYEKLVFEYKG